MPYIKKWQRGLYEEKVKDLAHTVKVNTKSDPMLRAGHLNYVITTLLLGAIPTPRRYADYNEIIGLLECAKQEMYRKAVAAYEDEKIKEEGDVF